MITNLSKIDEHCNKTKCEECKVWEGDGCGFYKALGIAFSLISRDLSLSIEENGVNEGEQE